MCKRHLSTKVKYEHQDIRKLKNEIQEAKQKKLESDGNFHRIGEAVVLSCSSSQEEGITLDMASDAKIAQLAQLVMRLKKKLVQL